MGNIHTVGPNEALIVSGGCCGSQNKTMIVGSWAWAWWLVTDVQRLSLEVMTLNPRCEHVETAQGVPLTVTGVAQCKVMREKEFLSTAAEQFLGKEVEHIKSVILQTLEGHLRAILGTLSVEEVYRDRDQFASLVRDVAAPDVGRMGIEILSFTIKDVFDKVEYLASLGKSRTAAVKRDADIGVAQAERDAGIREAECEKSSMDVKYGADTKIEDSHRLYQLQKANFDGEVNSRKAEAQLAYELQAAKMKQKIRSEEIEIDVVERRKQIDVEEKEIARKEKELTATIRLPAEAEAYRLEMIAQGKRTQTVEVARADAEKIKMIGGAEAYAIEAVGKAEAEQMRMKAAAYKQYGDAAITSLILDSLPKVKICILYILETIYNL
ncbi:flotillin-2-like [Centruroides sculpturatus]|uniref:flotillin-2-like n=1 Tax=Centruroides sculpturatus TaxID=218467 RepID=UPI000C6E00F3|nr:flotillin-2-like [Centruroides sculpturatus]